MEKYWNQEIECMSREDMKKLQSERLVAQVKHVYENVKYYRDLMDEKGVKPEDINGIEDLCKLPFLSKADLREARNERDRQIIDAVIAEILQCRDGAALARTGHTGNDQKIHNSILLARVQRDFSRLSYNAHLALQLDAELLPNALLHQLDQAQHIVAGRAAPVD